MVTSAVKRTVILARRECDYVPVEAELIEERVYPPDVVPELFGYRVLSRSCNQALACNLAGAPCKWSFLNPDNDPFA